MYIYKSSEEKFVKSVVLYADDNSKLFHDAEKTVNVTKDELFEAFMVGVAVCTAEGTYVKAVKYVDGGAEASIYTDADTALSSVTPVKE